MSSRLAFQTQLASIMEVLANAAVAEICKLVDDDYAVVSLQMSQCQRENKALKRKLHLLELKMARGNAERRLRESAMNNNNRPRLQFNSDRPRQSSPSTDGGFERQMEVALWSSGTAAVNAPKDLIQSNSTQSKSPDVELVEPEAVLVKEEKMDMNVSAAKETEEDVALIGDDGVVEHVPRGAAGQSVKQQDTQSASCQVQNQSSTARRSSSSSSSNSRGAESQKDEQPDVVLVKVEGAQPVMGTSNQTDLSIQEGLVESSTDDYRAALPLDETTQTSSNQLPDLQESGRGFSEVSYGHSSLWNNGAGGYSQEDSLPGPSSLCVPLPYVSTLIGAEPGSSGRGLAGESSRGFHTSGSFQQQHPVIDLSDDTRPIQVVGQALGPQQFLDPGQSLRSYSSDDMQQNVPKKRVCFCSFCGKGFSNTANLESHLRTHTGERPYGCSVCGKKFSQFWNLKIHKNIHTGERPYQCMFCPERYSDPSNLKKHEKRHHLQI